MSETAKVVEAPEVERHPGKFVWFELLTAEAPRAQGFHAAVFGWKVQPFPMGNGRTYEMITAGGTMIGGYAPPRRQGEPSRWVSYASVSDIGRAAAEAVAAGGRLLEPPRDIPGIGRRAALADPAGAEFSVLWSLMGDAPDTPAVPEGRWLWNELHVPDPAAAFRFYRRVLGFDHRVFAPDSAEPYFILSRDGVDRGGMTTAGCTAAPAHWLPYVHVQDVDGAVARARRAGSQIRMVEDIPGVGRLAVLTEPTGAAIALLSPKPG